MTNDSLFFWTMWNKFLDQGTTIVGDVCILRYNTNIPNDGGVLSLESRNVLNEDIKSSKATLKKKVGDRPFHFPN
jgi:hypothetical protein